MSDITIIWIALPYFLAFGLVLLPQVAALLGRVIDYRLLALAVPLLSLVYAAALFAQPNPVDLDLLDSFGVTLVADSLSAWFILTNALVTAAVVIYCWDTGKSAFFYTQAVILHGSVNATFICADLISLYVALEVIGIAAFLLVSYPRSDRTLWVALRYLFVSNTAMLFYLVGAILTYRSQNSFAFTGLGGAPLEAQALILLGLLVKGGVFVSGLWLPLTHAEAESPVSAMLSGVVVKAGVFPLVRLALLNEGIDPVVRAFGVATAGLGVVYALSETDSKRVLALSTVSQVGWVMAAPPVAGVYALAHGLVKAALFLTVGNLPSRNLAVLREKPMATGLWLPLAVGSLAIAGCPLFIGLGAKALTLEYALPWQRPWLTAAALGTATVYARFLVLPHQKSDKPVVKPGLWAALMLLLGALVLANVAYLGAYTGPKLLKAIATLGGGLLLHWLVVRRLTAPLPRAMEAFEHLIGGMSLVLVLLFWMVWSWVAI